MFSLVRWQKNENIFTIKMKRDIFNGIGCGGHGRWKTTKGDIVVINKMNYFQLGATVKKIERIVREKYKGIDTRCPGVNPDEVVGLKLDTHSKYQELKNCFKKQNVWNRRR